MVALLEAPPPGALGQLVALHGAWYARHWGFPLVFEAQVAEEAGAFCAALPHEDCRLFVAMDGERLLGGVALDGRGRPASRLRWFIVAEGARGGLGGRLLEAALGFARSRGFAEVWLTTFAGLDAARRLYERAGFRLEWEGRERGYGAEVSAQRFRLSLG